MALVKMKPTSAGRRGMVKVVNPTLHKGRPIAALTESKKRGSGRNNLGHITVRHRGGAHRPLLPGNGVVVPHRKAGQQRLEAGFERHLMRFRIGAQPGGRYRRVMGIFEYAKKVAPDIPTKTGIIVGMGETIPEIVEVMKDLRAVDVDILTLGQYLRPSDGHIALDRYYTPEEFRELYRVGMELGFRHVEAGPLVRSSYHAWEQVQAADWTRDDDRLRVSEVGEYGEVRPVHEVVLPEPGLLLDLVRERVTASVVLQRRVEVTDGRGLMVVARRAPAGGEVTWAYELDPGLDPDDPAVREAAAAGLRSAAEELGLR